MRLADPHFNVFHPYRGPAAISDSAERQLENNLTRALAICLTRLGASTARTLLLEALSIPHEDAVSFERCLLQVGAAEPGWPPPSKRSIAVVTGTAAETGDAPYSTESGVLDLVIIGKQFVLGIESKIGASVTKGHVAAHAKTLNIPAAEPASVAWASLARQARIILASHDMQPVSRFVLQQFEEYLRMNGFGGFTNDHFAYFALSSDERARATDTRVAIRRQMTEFVQQLSARLAWSFVEHVGKVTSVDAGAYAALKPTEKSQGKPSGQLPHLSIDISPSGLSIFFNVETNRAYAKFARAWEDDDDTFIKLLCGLSPDTETAGTVENPWRLAVVFRVPLGRPRASRGEPSFEIAALTARSMPPSVLTAAVTEGIRTISGGWSPEIQIVRHYNAALVCADDNFLDRVVADAKDLEPFFAWIGEPVR